MENGLQLTSELTSKWITFKNTESNFTLSSLITFAVLNQTLPNWQGSCLNKLRQIDREVALIPADGACKITW